MIVSVGALEVVRRGLWSMRRTVKITVNETQVVSGNRCAVVVDEASHHTEFASRRRRALERLEVMGNEAEILLVGKIDESGFLNCVSRTAPFTPRSHHETDAVDRCPLISLI